MGNETEKRFLTSLCPQGLIRQLPRDPNKNPGVCDPTAGLPEAGCGIAMREKMIMTCNNLKTLPAAVISASLLLLTAGPCLAVPVTFIHTGWGSGTLNGVSFGVGAPVRFTITEVGNTEDRTGVFGGFSIADQTATIAIDSVGLFDVDTETRTFVNQTTGLVGFSRAQIIGGIDLFNGPTNPVFSSWDMLTPLGPIHGSGTVLQWGPVFYPGIQTSGGDLVFNNGLSETTFQAIVEVPVTGAPEPVTAGLGVLGLGMLALYLQRRRSV